MQNTCMSNFSYSDRQSQTPAPCSSDCQKCLINFRCVDAMIWGRVSLSMEGEVSQIGWSVTCQHAHRHMSSCTPSHVVMHTVTCHAHCQMSSCTPAHAVMHTVIWRHAHRHMSSCTPPHVVMHTATCCHAHRHMSSCTPSHVMHTVTCRHVHYLAFSGWRPGHSWIKKERVVGLNPVLVFTEV